MDVLALSQADTSIKHFLYNHLAVHLRKNGHRLDFSRIQNTYDVCLFSENTTDIGELIGDNYARRFIVMDPKMNSRRQVRNVKLADGAIVSSIEQAEPVYRFQENVLIQPWFRYVEIPGGSKPKVERPKKVIKIVYHGNKVHLEALSSTLGIALEALAQEREIEFTAIYNIDKLGKWTKGLPRGLQINHLQWHPDSYLEQIAEADIGVIPNFIPTGIGTLNFLSHKIQARFKLNSSLNINTNDYLLRYKFNSNSGRLYEFALLGIPVVAESTLSISQDLIHGESGFLVLSSQGWQRSLRELVDNESLRDLFGKNLRNYFFEKYGKDAYLNKTLHFLSAVNNLKTSRS